MREASRLILVALLILTCIGQWSRRSHVLRPAFQKKRQAVMLIESKHRQDLQERVTDLQLCNVPGAAQDPNVLPFEHLESRLEMCQSTPASLDPLYGFMSIQL
jgi:hypothetical protein